MTAPSLKQKQFQEREDAIICAALKLFDQDHWQQVTVADIAKEAQIAKGTVYKHFVSKEELCGRIMLDFHEGLLKSFDAALPNDDALQLIQDMIRRAFEHYIAHPAAARVSYTCRGSSFIQGLPDPLRIRGEQLDAAFFGFFADVLQQGMANGQIPVRPVEQLILPIHSIFDGAMAKVWRNEFQEVPNSDVTLEDFLDMINGFITSSITAPVSGTACHRAARASSATQLASH
ncbi:TetR/AcrR family transcriptional regulator [Pokkaliibacter sp. CJK22405]|uniref:TetR/AcrR family transcriptional regulator n=1 Tax=Pokkaliibacter sp. CJK22405 TaxID=3384615 RepID=UPI003984C3E2